jgi:multidrug efflux pump subunit AcrA (membrane-fusion protein)
VQKGQWVELGAPVVRVVSLDKLRVVALVPETHLFSVRHGQTARLNIIMGATVDENGDAKESVISAEGKVSFVSPEVNPVNREFLVWVDIDNRNRKLRPGLVGTLSIDSGSKSAEPLLTNN